MGSAIEMVGGAAQRNPDAVALCANGIQLTYHELMSRVDRLADDLATNDGRFPPVRASGTFVKR